MFIPLSVFLFLHANHARSKRIIAAKYILICLLFKKLKLGINYMRDSEIKRPKFNIGQEMSNSFKTVLDLSKF